MNELKYRESNTGTPRPSPKFPLFRVVGALTFGLICIIVGLLIYPRINSFLNPDNRITGTYVNQDDPNEYLELNEDGTFYLKELGLGFSGEWDIEDNTVRLHLSDFGFTLEGIIQGNTIISEEGKIWVRDEQPSAPLNIFDLSQNKITGIWQEVSDPDTVVEFSEDGNIYWVNYMTGEKEIYGDYEILDDEILSISSPGEGSYPVKFSIADDILTVINMGGDIEKYKRIEAVFPITIATGGSK